MLREAARNRGDIVLSYSHKDRRLLKSLMPHLSSLQENGFRVWHDERIRPGDEWRSEIFAHLNTARAVVLLVSADFIASEPCQNEMKRARERHEREGTIVVAVLLRPCDWESILGKFQVLPARAKPVTKWTPRDDGYLSAAKGLLERLLSEPAPSEPIVPEEYFYNVPTPLTPFIGRKEEVDHVKRLLRSDDVRLLVLHALGGMGKTRLALEAAVQLRGDVRNGVCYVPLDQVKDPELVTSAIARALRIKEEETGQAEKTGTEKDRSRESSLKKSLIQYLANRQMLLLLDSFEHALSAGADVTDLLTHCPGLKVLLTSTVDPNITDAHKYAVPFLAVPDSLQRYSREELLKVDSVALFEQRARAKYGFLLDDKNARDVRDLCFRLEGVPLAIKLAAAQSEWFSSVRHMLDELDHQLSLLEDDVNGVPNRHRALEATITLSYEHQRLNDNGRELFKRLSVFSGSFSDVAAKEVCNPPEARPVEVAKGLRALREIDFIRKDKKEGRFKILEILREYGRERLAADRSLFCRKHAEFFVRLAEEAEPEITGPRRGDWLERLDADHTNLLAALHWCQKEKGSMELARELGLRLAGALSWFWNLRAHFSEGRNRLEAALDGTSGPTPERAKALYGLGMLAFLQGSFRTAIEKLEESTAIWDELDDRRRLGYAHIVLGMAKASLNQFPLAREHEEKSRDIFQELRDDWWLALALNDLGNVYRAQGDYDRAAELYRKSLRLWEKVHDPWGLPLTLSNLGFLEMQKARYNQAYAAFHRALDIQEEVGDRWGRAETIKFLADLAVRKLAYGNAAKLYRESLVLNSKIGRRPFIIGCLAGLAVLAEKRGELEHAARLVGFVDAHRGPVRVYAKSIDHSMYEKTVLAVHDLIREHAEGEQMSLEEATAYALRISGGWENDSNGRSRPKRARMSIPLRFPAEPREPRVRKGQRGRD